MTIKEIRALTGLTQAKFAERYGIPKRTVENWESGREPPGYISEMLERAVKEDYQNGKARQITKHKKEKRMKKIINGKKYDTETAREIATWDNGLGARDFGAMEETLYQKKTGEFFLYGEGGPATKYREAVDQNSWRGGEAIIPLTAEEAKGWMEQNCSVEEYESIFGEVAE